MKVKVDAYDHKILAALDKDARTSAAVIGKHVRLSKVAINHRISRLVSTGVIRRFVTHIDYRRLGYKTCHVLYRLQNISEGEEKAFYAYLLKDPAIGYLARMDGSFDAFVVFLYREADDLNMLLDDVNRRFGQHFQEREVLPVISVVYYGRTYLSDRKAVAEPVVKKGTVLAEPLDATDHRLLRTISQEARLPSTEIATRLGVSRDVVYYRLQQLKRRGIIQKYTLDIDHEALGLSFFKLLVRLRYDADKQRFLGLLQGYDQIIRHLTLVGAWDVEVDVEVEDNKQMRLFLKRLKAELGGFIMRLDASFVYRMDKFNYYPLD